MEPRTKNFVKRLLAVPKLPASAIALTVDFLSGAVTVDDKYTVIVSEKEFLIPANIYYDIKERLEEGKKIQAIKILKAKMGFGLKESKDAINDERNFLYKDMCLYADKKIHLKVISVNLLNLMTKIM
jgi:ribosomal protein L7/L12